MTKSKTSKRLEFSDRQQTLKLARRERGGERKREKNIQRYSARAVKRFFLSFLQHVFQFLSCFRYIGERNVRCLQFLIYLPLYDCLLDRFVTFWTTWTFLYSHLFAWRGMLPSLALFNENFVEAFSRDVQQPRYHANVSFQRLPSSKPEGFLRPFHIRPRDSGFCFLDYAFVVYTVSTDNENMRLSVFVS